jgi:hypothetical protein
LADYARPLPLYCFRRNWKNASPLPADAGPGPSTGGTDEPNDQPYGDVFFEDYGVHPFIDTEDDHFSTFAVDVDTASYTVMRRFIGDGHLPPDESVRVEEYVNFFEQDYEPPDWGEGAFAIHLEGAPSPYGGERYYLVRAGLQGYEVPAEMRKDVVLTFVIDVFGSMERENRLGLFKMSLRLLVEELWPTDKVGIAVYRATGQGNRAWRTWPGRSAASPSTCPTIRTWPSSPAWSNGPAVSVSMSEQTSS